MNGPQDREPIGALLTRRVREVETELLRGFRGYQPPDALRYVRSVAREIARDEAVEEARRGRLEAGGARP